MNFKYTIALIYLAFMTNGCAKLKNKFLPMSYNCGQSAKDWSLNFIKIRNADDKPIDGKNLSAELSGSALTVSEKGCVQIPEESKEGIFLARDKRPNVQEGKIQKLEELSLPIELKFEPAGPIVPQLNCIGESLETNSTIVEVEIADKLKLQADRLTIQAILKYPESGKVLSIIPSDNNVRVQLAAENLVDGAYEFEIIGNDKLRGEIQSLKTCRITLDRTSPNVELKLPEGMPLSLRDIAATSPRFISLRPDDRITIPESEPNSKALVSLNKFTSVNNTCDSPYFPAQSLETPKSGQWKICYYAEDRAGNRSELKSILLEINEEKNLLLIRSLIDNAKLNADRYRYESANESILSAYTEWKKLALERDRLSILSLLKSGFYDVLQKSHLVHKHPIQTYDAAMELAGNRRLVIRESDIAIFAENGDEIFSGLKDLDFIEARVKNNTENLIGFSDSKGNIAVIDNDGKPVFRFALEDGFSAQKLVFSSDGSMFAAGTVSGTIYVWSLKQSSLLSKQDLGSRIKGLVFAEDGSRIFAATKDGGIMTVSPKAKLPPKKRITLKSEPDDIFILRKDTLLVQTQVGMSTVNVQKFVEKNVYTSKENNTIAQICFSPDKMTLGISLDDGSFSLLNTKTFTDVDLGEISTLRFSKIALTNDKFSGVDKDGMAVVVGLEDSENPISFRVAEGEKILGLILNNDYLYSTTASTFSKLRIQNALLDDQSFELPTEMDTNEVSDLYFDKDKVSIGLFDGTLLTNSMGKIESRKLEEVNYPAHIYFGQDIFIGVGFEEFSVGRITDQSKPLTFSFETSANPESFRWNVVDESFFIGSDGMITLYSIDGKKIDRYETKTSPYEITSLAYSKAEETLISGGERRGVVSIWHQHGDATPPTEIDSHTLKIVALDFLDIGHEFISGSQDGTLARYNIDGKILNKVSAHSNELNSLITIKGDREIMTVGDDNQLRIWSDTLNPLSSVLIPSAGRLLKLSKDKDYLAIFTGNGEIISMPLSLSLLHERICNIGKIRGDLKKGQFCN